MLDLTFKEFELLKFLAQHPGRVFTRAQLLQEVWGYDYFGGTRTVDVHVRRLRAKLGPEHDALIGTVRNVGYRFVPAKGERAEAAASGARTSASGPCAATAAAPRHQPGDRESITGGTLTPAQVAEVLALAEAAAARDGVAPLSEHVLLHLRYEGRRRRPGPRSRSGLTGDGEIAGYAYLDPPGHPGWTAAASWWSTRTTGGHGLGLELVRALVAAADGYPVRLWAHGDLPAAAMLARAAGFERFRALWQMRRPLGDPLDQPAFPAGTTLRTFRPGQDEDEWLGLNARAFAKHPEQGAWTRHDLELREREPWFDPAGFFIADRHGAMAGFHWTKVHGPAEPGQASARSTWSGWTRASRAPGWAGR